MAQLVSVTVGNPPAGSCIPPEIQEWLQTSIFLNQSGLNNSQRILQQTTEPGADDRDVIWNKISPIGAPLGLFVYYNGAWRRYPMAPIGQRSFYTGPITGVFDPISLIGLPGTEWDGWKIDLTFANLFPIIAADYNVQAGAWQSTVQGSELTQGGAASITLDLSNVPVASSPALNATLHARGNPGIGNFVLWGDFVSGLGNETLIPASPGNPNPVAFNNTPPWVAQAQVVFVGISV